MYWRIVREKWTTEGKHNQQHWKAVEIYVQKFEKRKTEVENECIFNVHSISSGWKKITEHNRERRKKKKKSSNKNKVAIKIR
jgi:hypothetical protein